MPTSILGLVLFILASLVGAGIWFFKRKTDPAPQQRADTRSGEINALYDEIARLEAAGNFAAADALRYRLQNTLVPDAQRDADGAGQRLPPPAPGGNGADAPK